MLASATLPSRLVYELTLFSPCILQPPPPHAAAQSPPATPRRGGHSCVQCLQPIARGEGAAQSRGGQWTGPGECVSPAFLVCQSLDEYLEEHGMASLEPLPTLEPKARKAVKMALIQHGGAVQLARAFMERHARAIHLILIILENPMLWSIFVALLISVSGLRVFLDSTSGSYIEGLGWIQNRWIAFKASFLCRTVDMYHYP